MCQKRSSSYGLIVENLGTPKSTTRKIRLDKCMHDIIQSLSYHGYITVGCCCGHGRYPMTIICQVSSNKKLFFDLISGKDVKNKIGGGPYKSDKQGYFYIPEVCKEKK